MYASHELQNDKEVVLKAIKKEPCLLEYASDYLKNDKEVVMIALNKSVYGCWRHVGKEQKEDPEVCKLAVSLHFPFLQDSSYLLKNDK